MFICDINTRLGQVAAAAAANGVMSRGKDDFFFWKGDGNDVSKEAS